VQDFFGYQFIGLVDYRFHALEQFSALISVPARTESSAEFLELLSQHLKPNVRHGTRILSKPVPAGNREFTVCGFDRIVSK
jgi:hypothetical protein